MTGGFTQQENNIILNEKGLDYCRQFLKKFKKRKVTLFFNERKPLLLRIYLGLFRNLKKHGFQVTSCNLETAYPGILTNYESKGYIEPESVFVLLTKKHNTVEKRILKECHYSRTPTNVLKLGITTGFDEGNVFLTKNVKELYVFLYALEYLIEPITYQEFSKNYVNEKHR